MSIGVVVGSQYRITYLFDCHRKMIFSDIRSCMGRSGLPRVPSRPQTIPFDAPEACTKFRGRAWPGSKWVNLGPFAKMHYGTGGVAPARVVTAALESVFISEFLRRSLYVLVSQSRSTKDRDYLLIDPFASTAREHAEGQGLSVD